MATLADPSIPKEEKPAKLTEAYETFTAWFFKANKEVLGQPRTGYASFIAFVTRSHTKHLEKTA